MCDHELDIYCESAILQQKLEKLISSQFTTDQYGVNFVRVQFIENLIMELECE